MLKFIIMAKGPEAHDQPGQISPRDAAIAFRNSLDVSYYRSIGFLRRSYTSNTEPRVIVNDISGDGKFGSNSRLNMSQALVALELQKGTLTEEQSLGLMSSAARQLSEAEADPAEKERLSQLAQGFSELQAEEAKQHLERFMP